MRTIGVLGVAQGERAVGAATGLRVSNGPFALTCVEGGWAVEGPTYRPWTIEELRQLGEAIKLVTASNEAPTSADVEVEGGITTGAVDEARKILQGRAEEMDSSTLLDGGPDVEDFLGPVESIQADYREAQISMHMTAKDRLLALRESNTIDPPISMVHIGDVDVPDRSQSSTYQDPAWDKHIWPLWKLHEDGFIVIAPDGKTAEITRQGKRALAQIDAGTAFVYEPAAWNHDTWRPDAQ